MFPSQSSLQRGARVPLKRHRASPRRTPHRGPQMPRPTTFEAQIDTHTPSQT